MNQPRRDRGSALLISLVVVIIAVGIGGAFLSQAIFHANEQKWQSEADEAMAMCDAGMERARQALGAYKGTNSSGNVIWPWLSVCHYCQVYSTPQSESPTLQQSVSFTNGVAFTAPFPLYNSTTFGTNGLPVYSGTVVTDGATIKTAALAFMANPLYKPLFSSYASTIWSPTSTTNTTYTAIGSTSATADNTNPASLVPANLTGPPTSADIGKVLFGNFIPFNRGVLYIVALYPEQTYNTPVDLNSNPPPAEPTNLEVIVTAVLPSGLVRQVDGIVTKVPQTAPAYAAVVSDATVSTLGNITIDGNNWSEDGTTWVRSAGNVNDKPGILTPAASVSIGGSSAVGGAGTAPGKSGATAGSITTNYNGFGTPPGSSPFPPDADSFLNAKEGTLAAMAQAQGTYITSQAQFTALLAANGGALPGGKVIYNTWDPGGSLEIGSGNTPPSILVFHDSTGSSVMTNVHGTFTGLIMADAIDHVNSGTVLIGEVVVFSPTANTTGNVFGNGNSTIKFSQQAIDDALNAVNASDAATLQAYRRYP